MVNLIDQVVQSAAMGNDASTVIPIAEISGNSRNRFEPETMLQGLSLESLKILRPVEGRRHNIMFLLDCFNQ